MKINISIDFMFGFQILTLRCFHHGKCLQCRRGLPCPEPTWSCRMLTYGVTSTKSAPKWSSQSVEGEFLRLDLSANTHWTPLESYSDTNHLLFSHNVNASFVASRNLWVTNRTSIGLVVYITRHKDCASDKFSSNISLETTSSAAFVFCGRFDDVFSALFSVSRSTTTSSEKIEFFFFP